MTAGVYAIINTVDGRRYIGSTKDFETRGNAHRTALRTGALYVSQRLTEALKSFGSAAFEVELIEVVEPDDEALEDAERRWMQHFDETAPGSLYNVDRSGRRPFWRTGHKPGAARRPAQRPTATTEEG